MEKKPLDVKAIFDRALEIEAATERRAYLDEACAEAPELRQKVEALLKAYDDAGSFLEKPVPGLGATVDSQPAQPGGEDGPRPASVTSLGARLAGEGPGSLIGPYKLLQQIGEGGMGTVWMAEQTQPVQRKVALKLIKAGMDSKQVIVRFEAERQALAMMDHVNIARVFDGGATEAGRPYFVMELVHGVPITKYCDDNHLTPRERLELFVPVCQAIQHAHQKGIIHRDIKPSNVMVTLYDGKPVPKVIDFGVAKATEQKLTERTLFTQYGTMVGTLEYMSPEQAEMSALGADTRSDIYSLGVLLYELLTGSTPLTPKRMKEAAYAEILRMIKEEEPPKPSTRLSDSGEALASISANRHTEPAKLTKLVRGELDWIVMKTLEKDRNRRYETVNGFAADVQRYLADEAVQACPPSARYRLGKFLRRNRGPVLAASLVLLALFGAGIGAAFALIEAGKHREVTALWQQAEQERHAAEVARGAAEAAREGEKKAKREAEDALEKLAAVEYGRTMQVAYQEWRDTNVAATLALLDSTRADLRGWEWRYVHRLCHSDILTIKSKGRNYQGFLSASFSPDGSRLVTAGGDGTVKVWDARTGAELLTLKGHAAWVYSASFSADGLRVVTGGRDGTARVWNAKTGAELLCLKAHSHQVNSASFSPDGSRVVTASYDKTARVWDAKTGAELLTLKGHTSSINSASFSPDESRVVTASYDGTARVWDAWTGAELLTLKGHTSSINSASFSPDGSRVLTGSIDQTARVWDAKTGAELLTLKGHANGIRSASFSADGSRVVTGSHDQTARVWDAKTGAELLTLKGHTEQVWSASFSPDGSRVVTASWDGTVKVWDARTGADVLIPKWHSQNVWSTAFSPDGSRVLTGGNRDGTARVWDAKTGAELLTLKGHTSVQVRASFSPDGSRVLTGSMNRTARVWDARTGAELLTLKGQTEGFYSASFSPDGSRVVTGGRDGTARVWDAKTGAELLCLKAHSQEVRSASFSPDGSRVVTASYGDTAGVWDARTGAELLTLKGHTFAVFSPDGSRIITGGHDGTARVWDAKTGAELLTLKVQNQGCCSASFSPDRSRVVTVSWNGTVKVWDARTGAELLSFERRNHPHSASFSPDGARLVTEGLGGARVWDATPVRKGEGIGAAPHADRY